MSQAVRPQDLTPALILSAQKTARWATVISTLRLSDVRQSYVSAHEPGVMEPGAANHKRKTRFSQLSSCGTPRSEKNEDQCFPLGAKRYAFFGKLFVAVVPKPLPSHPATTPLFPASEAPQRHCDSVGGGAAIQPCL